MTTYHFSVTVDGGFDAVVQKTKTALDAEGFRVLSEIDVAATMKERLGLESPNFLILGASNPQFSLKAVQTDPSIGVLLPFGVVVRENGNGRVIVDFTNPEKVLSLVDKPGVERLASEIRSRLEMVRDTLAGS